MYPDIGIPQLFLRKRYTKPAHKLCRFLVFTQQSTAVILWPWWSSKMVKTSCGGGRSLVWWQWWSLQGPHEFHFVEHSVYLLVLPQDVSIACLKVAHLTDISNMRNASRWRWVCIGITFISQNIVEMCIVVLDAVIMEVVLSLFSLLWWILVCTVLLDQGIDTWVETANWISDNTRHALYCMVKPATPAKTAK